VDVPPKQKTTPRERIAQCVRSFGAAERGVRVNAWTAAERTLESERLNWSDVGNWIEAGEQDESKYTEAEMQEFAQCARVEGVEAGIKIGMARASNGSGNGHLTLPKPLEMAEYCRDRLARLKDDKQREFVSDMCVMTRRGMTLSLGRLGYLASIYIQIGGRI
jgi:hypothetical protein